MPIAALALLLAPAPLPAAAGQDVTSRPTILSPSDRHASQGPPAPTMVALPIALAIAGFDADGDGRTSRFEMTSGVARSFASVDIGHSDKLRYLDYAEWALRYLGDRNALPSPQEVDSDGDDTITLAELQAVFASAFDRLDTNHDGYVSRAELLTIRSGAGGDRGEGPGGRHGKKPPR